MAKRRGRGVAAVNYPTGMNLGGDPTQALVHATTTGSFVVTLSSVDLGQGLKTGDGADLRRDDRRPGRHRSSSTPPTPTPARTAWAPSPAAARTASATPSSWRRRKREQVLLEVAAEELEVDASDLETDGKGNIHVKGAPEKSISIFETALAAHFKHGRTISGRGMFLQPRSYPEPETGEMTPADLLCPCLHGRRGRGRHRDRRGDGPLAEERLSRSAARSIRRWSSSRSSAAPGWA